MTDKTREAFERAFEQAWENNTTGLSDFAWVRQHIRQTATAEADAKYLPVIEKLVEAQRKVLRDPGMHGLSINTRERIHSILALAKPLLEKKEEV